MLKLELMFGVRVVMLSVSPQRAGDEDKQVEVCVCVSVLVMSVGGVAKAEAEWLR